MRIAAILTSETAIRPAKDLLETGRTIRVKRYIKLQALPDWRASVIQPSADLTHRPRVVRSQRRTLVCRAYCTTA